MSAVNPISGLFISGIPSFRVNQRRANSVIPQKKSTPRSAQVDLSWASDLRRAALSATEDKAANVQTMLNTLQKILGRTSSLRAYADKLRSEQESSVDISQLSAFNATVSEQIIALKAKVEALQARQRNDSDQGALATALEFAQMHVLKLDREEDVPATAGIQALLRRTNQRVGSLENIETHLMDQIDKLQKRLQELTRELDDRYGRPQLDSPRAKEIAANTAEQIRQRMDIIRGTDDTRQSSRIASLLRNT